MFEIIQAYLAEFTYGGIFLVLLLCGLGLPLPEDVPIIVSGYLTHLGTIKAEYALAVNFAGVLSGDMIIYSLGYWWGPRATQHRTVRAILNPRRLKKVERFFGKHGRKAVFFGRFLAGLRAPLFLAAGMMRVPVWRFFGMDFLAAALSIPVLFFAAFYFGDELDTLRKMLGTTKNIVAFIVAAGAIWFAVHYYIRRRGNNTEESAT
ncbi:MAG: DedA family protein [Nitrospinaceae bacterium]|jgi:membrane protein DedA with SNARE-associated domain|nr:DedA family protein [Nitrospinaceae bacterium]MBT3434763.1 DedA family protein [Nitrospinaceae bacterium]MBT3823063.1 DedA family protein [Nitrospinaceae bacterium]MBT4095852.1 DedA family protein [Nitrospinaceae bacterium]MBT4430899.1 DedA family protein [Nitrospinaceae bacterium]